MEELNNRKINQREKLANIEKETDAHVFDVGKEVTEVEETVRDREKNYKVEFKQRQRDMKVNLQMINQDFARAEQQLEENMKDDVDNYEQRFQEWKKLKEEEVKVIKENLTRYNQIQSKKITDKKDVISEIDAGIASLKEMSAEVKTE